MLGRYVLLSGLLLLINPVNAALHALVIGIDDYHHGSDLFGAVNDAEDIAAALEQSGAATVRILLNDDAHRDAIFSAWNTLKAQAKPGDTLLLSYAGHGSQEPERVPQQESDGLDEVLLLGNYKASAPANYQRIVDDELRQMVLEAQDFEVVMVFDACHSGTLNRVLSREVRKLPTRFTQYGAISNDSLPPPPSLPETQPGTLEHETYLAASLDSRQTPEIEINGQIRGALSYYFAKAVRGEADQNRDGRVSRAELRHYIQTNVRQLSEGRQEPTVDFAPSTQHKPLFLNSRSSSPSDEIWPVKNAPPTAPLRLALIGTDKAGNIVQSLQGIKLVASSTDAVLTWDVPGGQLISAMNDVVAYVSTNATPAPYSEVQSIIDKWTVLAPIKQLAEGVPLAVTIKQGNRLHRQGETLSFAIEPRQAPYLTLLNLASGGEVQYLYPLADYGDDPKPSPEQEFVLDIEVSPPFGADHLLALTSTRQPQALQQALQALDQQAAAGQLLELLHTALANQTISQIGLLGAYTAPLER